MHGDMRIGIDFDNTIAGYDGLFGALAMEAGLIEGPSAGGRIALRDGLRGRPGGEVAWQKLQAQAFGPRIDEAELMEGIANFFDVARRRQVSLFIVSHKSRRAAQDPAGVDLRCAAIRWMESHGFFAKGIGLSRRQVFFEPTRQCKVARIASLGLTHFVDDLDEVFVEPGFPAGVQPVLFRPTPGPGLGTAGWLVCDHWDRITEHVLGASH